MAGRLRTRVALSALAVMPAVLVVACSEAPSGRTEYCYSYGPPATQDTTTSSAPPSTTVVCYGQPLASTTTTTIIGYPAPSGPSVTFVGTRTVK